MRRFFAIVLVCFFSVAALGQAKHPFTFEDMMKLKRVGEPVPSPDGKWVLFSVIDVDLAANTKTSHIWIVPLSGGQERVRAGRRTENDLRSSRTKRADRKFGWQVSIRRLVRSPTSTR